MNEYSRKPHNAEIFMKEQTDAARKVAEQGTEKSKRTEEKKGMEAKAGPAGFPYEDILRLPHHVSRHHPPMPREDRAAQFSPFAALTGYDDAVLETARLTDAWHDLSDEQTADLDRKVQILEEHISERPAVRIRYFVPDEKKAGGSYEVKAGRLRRIDTALRILVFADGTEVAIDKVSGIDIPENG